MTTSTWTDADLTPTDAVKQIRKLTVTTVKGSRARVVFLSVQQRAPIVDKPDHVFPVLGSIKVTRQQAEKFIADAYTANLAARGALVHFSWCDTCIFVG